jgi:hypothetical protein
MPAGDREARQVHDIMRALGSIGTSVLNIIEACHWHAASTGTSGATGRGSNNNRIFVQAQPYAVANLGLQRMDLSISQQQSPAIQVCYA